MLGVHYLTKRHSVNDDEINLMLIVADQISLAIHQAKLCDDLKKITANQKAILKNMPFMAWLKDKDGKLLAANEPFAQMCSTTVENLIS